MALVKDAANPAAEDRAEVEREFFVLLELHEAER